MKEIKEDIEVDGKGIYQSLRDENYTHSKSSFDVDELKKRIIELSSRPHERPEFILRTGTVGMILFDLLIRKLNNVPHNIKWDYSQHKGCLVIHIHKKHGLLKAYLYYSSLSAKSNEFILKHGTRELLRTDNLSGKDAMTFINQYSRE